MVFGEKKRHSISPTKQFSNRLRLQPKILHHLPYLCVICESEKLLNLCAQKSWAQTVDEIDPLRERSDLKRQDSHYLLHPHPLLLSSTDQYTLYFRYLSLKDRISSNYKVLFSKCIYTPVFNSLVHAIYFKSLITEIIGDK